MSKIIKAISKDKTIYCKGYYQTQKSLGINAGLVSNIANHINKSYKNAKDKSGVIWTFEIVASVPDGCELIKHNNISDDKKEYIKQWKAKHPEKMDEYKQKYKLNRTKSHHSSEESKPDDILPE